LISAIKAKKLDVLVIDDGSGDKTAHIAEEKADFLIRHKENMGKGVALREGIAFVLDKNYDAIIVMDADGQHDVSDLDNFLGPAQQDKEAAIITGNRMSNPKDMPWLRRLTNALMSGLISRLAKVDIPDTQCGFRLIKREVLEAIKLKSSNYEIESELLIQAARSGFKIISVPIKSLYRGEVSKINPIIDTIRFFRLIKRLTRQK